MQCKDRLANHTEHDTLISSRAAKAGPLRSTLVFGTTGFCPWFSLKEYKRMKKRERSKKGLERWERWEKRVQREGVRSSCDNASGIKCTHLWLKETKDRSSTKKKESSNLESVPGCVRVCVVRTRPWARWLARQQAARIQPFLSSFQWLPCNRRSRRG